MGLPAFERELTSRSESGRRVVIHDVKFQELMEVAYPELGGSLAMELAFIGAIEMNSGSNSTKTRLMRSQVQYFGFHDPSKLRGQKYEPVDESEFNHKPDASSSKIAAGKADQKVISKRHAHEYGLQEDGRRLVEFATDTQFKLSKDGGNVWERETVNKPKFTSHEKAYHSILGRLGHHLHSGENAGANVVKLKIGMALTDGEFGLRATEDMHFQFEDISNERVLLYVYGYDALCRMIDKKGEQHVEKTFGVSVGKIHETFEDTLAYFADRPSYDEVSIEQQLRRKKPLSDFLDVNAGIRWQDPWLRRSISWIRSNRTGVEGVVRDEEGWKQEMAMLMVAVQGIPPSFPMRLKQYVEWALTGARVQKQDNDGIAFLKKYLKHAELDQRLIDQCKWLYLQDMHLGRETGGCAAVAVLGVLSSEE